MTKRTTKTRTTRKTKTKTSEPTLKYDSAEDCPDVRKHTKTPWGYAEKVEWAERKMKTHTCERCPTCGFFSIWRRKKRR